jgi:hypothetical protein
MGNEIVRTEGRAVAAQRTPEGAQALRLIASSAAWRIEDAAEVEARLSPQLRAALPVALVEAAAMLAPATRGDFKRLVAPSLALVAPAGMSEEDQTAWLAVAAETLRGIPADLLTIGCRAAREVADHPSKIVPAIMKTVKRYWDGRRDDAARLDRLGAIARGERRRLPWEDAPFDSTTRADPAQAAEILREHGLPVTPTAQAAPAPRREPTIDDYLDLGLTRDEAQTAMDDRRRMLARGRAKPIGEISSDAVAA